jgi:hypothetical protein
VISPQKVAPAIVGRPYSVTFQVAGVPDAVFSTPGPLPDGITLDTATGVLSGMATRIEETFFALSATSAGCAIPSTAIRLSTVVVAPGGTVTTSLDAGSPSDVRRLTFDGAPADSPLAAFAPFDPGFTGGARIAQSDLNGDGVPDVIAAAGPGANAEVRIYDGATGGLRTSFLAFDPGMQAGVFVAAGDVTGDGFADIVAGAGGGPSRMRVFDGRTLSFLAEIFPFGANVQSGIRVAAGDVNGDGFADLIAGTGPGPVAEVRIFDGRNQALLFQLHPIPQFTGGVFVASGDVTGDGIADVVTGADAGGGPAVSIFTSEARQDNGPGFYALDGPPFSGAPGVRVAVGDITGDGLADIIAAAGPPSAPEVRIFDATARHSVAVPVMRFNAYPPSSTGGMFVAMTVPIARMAIDSPSPSATTAVPFRLSGWAFEDNIAGRGITVVEVTALPVGSGAPVNLGTATRNDPRPDVAAVFGAQYANAGFHLDVSGLAVGEYDLRITARGNAASTVKVRRTVRVRIAPRNEPIIIVDTPTAGAVSTAGFTVSGWALSRSVPTAPGVDAVHVWAAPASGGSPIFLGAATMGLSRPDVAEVFGSAYVNSGYTLATQLPPGTWQLLVFPHETGGTFHAPVGPQVVSISGTARRIATGADSGGSPLVRQFPAIAGPSDPSTTDLVAGDATFSGGVRVAEGDVNGDGVADLIAGWGPGSRPTVFVYDGHTGAELAAFDAFEPGFTGGVFVAAGDVDSDGFADVIVSSGPGRPATVDMFSGRDFRRIRHYDVFDFSFRGGVTVAAGDLDGDGLPEIIVGSGPGVASQIRIFGGVNGSELPRIAPYGPFTGGVYVAAGDVNGDGFADIVTGPGAGGGPHVRVFDGRTHAAGLQFFASGFTGGVRVAAGDVTGDGHADIIAGAGPGGTPDVVVFDGVTGAEVRRSRPYAASFTGGVFVSTAMPQNRMMIDRPLPGSAPRSFEVAGWAFNEHPSGTDIDAIHVWAIGVFGGGPIFLGSATIGIPRPDVAAIFGEQYGNSGYLLRVTDLPPGTYDITVSGHSAKTSTFTVMRVVRIVISP